MASLVYRRTRVSRSTFKKLPRGASYLLASAVNTAPSMKIGGHRAMTAFVTDHLTPLPPSPNVADATVAVVRVPEYFTRAT